MVTAWRARRGGGGPPPPGAVAEAAGSKGRAVAEPRTRAKRAAGAPDLHTREADREVAAFQGLVDRGPLNLDEPGGAAAAQPTGDAPGHLHVEAAHLRRIGRVGFDERCSAFGVAAPEEHRGSRALRAVARQRAHQEREAPLR